MHLSFGPLFFFWLLPLTRMSFPEHWNFIGGKKGNKCNLLRLFGLILDSSVTHVMYSAPSCAKYKLRFVDVSKV